MDHRILKPWKAAVGFLVCAGLALLFVWARAWNPALCMAFVSGMWLQDWAERIRVKYADSAGDEPK